MLTMGTYLKMMPKFAHDILKQIARGRQAVEVRHSGFAELAGLLEKGVNRLIIGLIVSASLIAASLILGSGRQLMEFTVYMLGGQRITLAALLGLTGYGLASLLGVWLVVSILRSGKL
jgi:ubiquinone biosynthesis protein